MSRIAIFASGRGSNAKKIIHHFEDKNATSIALVVSNKKDAPVLALAEQHNIPTIVLTKSSFYHSKEILSSLQSFQIDFIALAGFLWLLPAYLIKAYPKKILNIHPALLPKYGGKGMYGMNVHHAVREAHEKHSGISIHYVNEHYDEGNILFQASCEIHQDDSAEDIAKKVQTLEHQYFPSVIEAILPNLEYNNV